MENETTDHRQIICPIQCDLLLDKDQPHLTDYLEFCSNRLVSAIIYSDKKELHLSGSGRSILETEKRFSELQDELFIESQKKQMIQGIHWWFETWDASWQLYDSKMTSEIEYHYQLDKFNFALRNPIGEKVSVDLNKLVETYGTRIKRMRRSKFDDQLPKYWSPSPLGLEKFPLEVNSTEYLWIKNSFDKTMNQHYMTIISIERIQNVRLLKQFSISHDDFIVRYGKENDGTMNYLYHGCPHASSKRIIERGFNRSYCGVNGCAFGRGVYFSTDASFSDKYATANDQREKRMFFSRVLLGRSTLGNPNTCEPPDEYDTTTNGTHIFVCYYDSQCYPEYLLTYM